MAIPVPEPSTKKGVAPPIAQGPPAPGKELKFTTIRWLYSSGIWKVGTKVPEDITAIAEPLLHVRLTFPPSPTSNTFFEAVRDGQ